MTTSVSRQSPRHSRPDHPQRPSPHPRMRQHEKAKNTAALNRRRKRRNQSQMTSTKQPRADPILLSAI